MAGGFQVSPVDLRAAKTQLDEASSHVRAAGVGVAGVGRPKAGTARVQTTIERELHRLSEAYRTAATQLDGVARQVDANSQAYVDADETSRKTSKLIRDALG